MIYCFLKTYEQGFMKLQVLFQFFQSHKTMLTGLVAWGSVFALQSIWFPSYPSIITAWYPGAILLSISYSLVSFLGLLPSGGSKFVYILLIVACLVYTVTYTCVLCHLIEKQRLYRVFLLTLSVLMVAGAMGFGSRRIAYSEWTHTASVLQRMNHSEYSPNHADYRKEIVIPKCLAGAMLGVHAAVTLFGMVAVMKMINARVRKNRKAR